MAVVINNFEMPKHCFNCSRKINPEERQCNIDHHVFEETLGVITNYRDKDCPLQEIPQLEDCVSRMEVLRIVSNFWLNKCIDNKVFSRITDCFNDMPYVLPKLPTSDDCVSRQAVLDKAELIELEDGQKFYCIDPEDVKALPPVTPTRKVGKWVYDKASQNWRCSECNETPKTLGYVGTADFMAEHFRFFQSLWRRNGGLLN